MTEELREVVLTLRPLRRGAPSNEQKLSDELRIMRRGGFEVDLFVRGLWYRDGHHGRGKRMRLIEERRLEHWQWDGTQLRFADDIGSWMPAMGKKPAPEIVLRGTRRVA